MKKILPTIVLPMVALATSCQQTTVHTYQSSAALAGASSGGSSSTARPSTTSAAASSYALTNTPRAAATHSTAIAVSPAPRLAAAPPTPAKKPDKREIYEEKTSEVVETYVFPASDEEMAR